MIVLKPGKEKSLKRRHPWIFSGAIDQRPLSFEPGEIFPVYSATGDWLALAYFHPHNSLAGRVISFQDLPHEEVIQKSLQRAVELRSQLFQSKSKMINAYRLVNAEGDGLPGLVVDSYGDVLSLQITTCGMERLRPLIVSSLIDLVHPTSVYEKSHGAARLQEGLEERSGLIYGSPCDEVEIIEHGLRFIVSLKEGQKTGFFLDQREMRQMIARYAKGKRVLNAFSYSGGFSVAALSAGASLVDSVDVCAKAGQLCKRNVGFLSACDRHRFFQEDVFDFLQRSPLEYDIVILDPPAFAKKRSDVESACRGYKQIMRETMRKVPSGTLLLTCSCSHYIDESLFHNLVAQAAEEAGRDVTILSKHIQAPDHPISVYHPEGHYLKSLFLRISF